MGHGSGKQRANQVPQADEGIAHCTRVLFLASADNSLVIGRGGKEMLALRSGRRPPRPLTPSRACSIATSRHFSTASAGCEPTNPRCCLATSPEWVQSKTKKVLIVLAIPRDFHLSVRWFALSGGVRMLSVACPRDWPIHPAKKDPESGLRRMGQRNSSDTPASVTR